jgi:hypothetical protein
MQDKSLERQLDPDLAFCKTPVFRDTVPWQCGDTSRSTAEDDGFSTFASFDVETAMGFDPDVAGILSAYSENESDVTQRLTIGRDMCRVLKLSHQRNDVRGMTDVGDVLVEQFLGFVLEDSAN